MYTNAMAIKVSQVTRWDKLQNLGHSSLVLYERTLIISYLWSSNLNNITFDTWITTETFFSALCSRGNNSEQNCLKRISIYFEHNRAWYSCPSLTTYWHFTKFEQNKCWKKWMIRSKFKKPIWIFFVCLKKSTLTCNFDFSLWVNNLATCDVIWAWDKVASRRTAIRLGQVC